MPEIPKKYMEFLSAETKVWEDEGIISSEQTEQILGLYVAGQWSLAYILYIAGAVMLGLGGVSFALAHWHDLPKVLRVCMILAGYAGSLVAHVVTGRNTKAGKAFLLLAGVIFGAGIYLITRMYDYRLSLSEVLGWWLVHLTVTALCTRDDWQEYFAQGVALVYLNVINAIDIFALEFMGSAKAELTEFFTPVEGFVLIGALWAVNCVIKDRAAFNVNMLLTVLVIASRMSLCFGGTWTLILLWSGCALLSFCRYGDAEVFGLLVLGLCGVVLTWPEVWRGEVFPADWRNVLAVVSAVLTAVMMLFQMWRGHGVVGIVFCALIIMRYFFDRLFGYLPKAWGFGIAGVVFVGLGIYTAYRSSRQA